MELSVHYGIDSHKRAVLFRSHKSATTSRAGGMRRPHGRCQALLVASDLINSIAILWAYRYDECTNDFRQNPGA